MKRTASIAAVIAVSVLAAGCTSATPISDASPPVQTYSSPLLSPRNGNSAIRVTRDGGLLGSACSFHISIDGQQVARLNPGQTVVTYVRSGLHRVTANTTDLCMGGLFLHETTSTTAGRETDIRVFTSMSGFSLRDSGTRQMPSLSSG